MPYVNKYILLCPPGILARNSDANLSNAHTGTEIGLDMEEQKWDDKELSPL